MIQQLEKALSKVLQYFEGNTVPCPEKAVAVIEKGALEEIQEQLPNVMELGELSFICQNVAKLSPFCQYW